MNWEVWSEIEAALVRGSSSRCWQSCPITRTRSLRLTLPLRTFGSGSEPGRQGLDHRLAWIPAQVCHLPSGSSDGQEEIGIRRRSGNGAGREAPTGSGDLNQQGITSRLWIAPSNSFDATTVSLLPKFGISMICDGHFRFPFLARSNMFWVPHQLFGFRPAPSGVWTVCYHHNQWTAADLRKFREDLDHYGAQISSWTTSSGSGRGGVPAGRQCSAPARVSLLCLFAAS